MLQKMYIEMCCFFFGCLGGGGGGGGGDETSLSMNNFSLLFRGASQVASILDELETDLKKTGE